MASILIIEDEKDLAELLEFNLRQEGFFPKMAYDGLTGLNQAISNPPDMIILDLMLPGMLGTEVCKRLKNNPGTAQVPIIMLTAKGEEIDRVVGFEVGAEDYVVKPFSVRELILRVKAVLRRTQPQPISRPVLTVGPMIIDQDRHQVVIQGEEITLTSTEFRLLAILASRLGRLQSRETLLQDAWGYGYTGDTRTVDTHVTRLRTKLGSAGNLIKTVRGFGYKMDTI
ncbi:MAG: response regulator transcription factor [Deltaproteobacteria bacterium]|nr:response regulator transcription factor [Deltaproteobacteria bacterium]